MWQGSSAGQAGQPVQTWSGNYVAGPTPPVMAPATVPVPPGNSSCHRCGAVDHWIRDCPVALADRGNTCRRCGQAGHWARECPQKLPAQGPNLLNRGLKKPRTAGSEVSEEVYLKVGIEGKLVHALLDTGCEHSVMGKSLLPMHPIQPTQYRLFAANGTGIPLVGQTVVRLRVGSQEMNVSLLVTESMNELILGADWLVENRCCWNFGSSQLNVNGRVLPLFGKPASHRCSRVYASEAVTLRSQEQTTLPVRIVGATWRPSVTPVVTEPRMVQEGILSARAVLPGGTGQSVMCVVNLTDRDYIMKAEDLIATAAEVNARKPAESETIIRTRIGGVTMQPGPVNGAHVQEIIDSLPTSL